MNAEILLPKKVYRNTWWVQVVSMILLLLCLFVIFCWVMGIIQAIDIQDSRSIFPLLCLVVMIAFFLFVAVSLLRIRLEVSHDGVNYYNIGMHTYTPWQNIVGIEKVKTPMGIMGWRFANALELREPAQIGVPIQQGKRLGIAVIEKSWWLPHHDPFLLFCSFYIPLARLNISQDDIDGPGELASYMRYYIPHRQS